MTQKID